MAWHRYGGFASEQKAAGQGLWIYLPHLTAVQLLPTIEITAERERQLSAEKEEMLDNMGGVEISLVLPGMHSFGGEDKENLHKEYGPFNTKYLCSWFLDAAEGTMLPMPLGQKKMRDKLYADAGISTKWEDNCGIATAGAVAGARSTEGKGDCDVDILVKMGDFYQQKLEEIEKARRGDKDEEGKILRISPISSEFGDVPVSKEKLDAVVQYYKNIIKSIKQTSCLNPEFLEKIVGKIEDQMDIRSEKEFDLDEAQFWWDMVSIVIFVVGLVPGPHSAAFILVAVGMGLVSAGVDFAQGQWGMGIAGLVAELLPFAKVFKIARGFKHLKHLTPEKLTKIMTFALENGPDALKSTKGLKQLKAAGFKKKHAKALYQLLKGNKKLIMNMINDSAKAEKYLKKLTTLDAAEFAILTRINKGFGMAFGSKSWKAFQKELNGLSGILFEGRKGWIRMLKELGYNLGFAAKYLVFGALGYVAGTAYECYVAKNQQSCLLISAVGNWIRGVKNPNFQENRDILNDEFPSITFDEDNNIEVDIDFIKDEIEYDKNIEEGTSVKEMNHRLENAVEAELDAVVKTMTDIYLIEINVILELKWDELVDKAGDGDIAEGFAIMQELSNSISMGDDNAMVKLYDLVEAIGWNVIFDAEVNNEIDKQRNIKF